MVAQQIVCLKVPVRFRIKALKNNYNEFRISERSVFHFYNNGFREPSIMLQVKETVKNTSILIDNTIDLEKVAETFLS